MTIMNRKSVEELFGKTSLVEDIRTSVLVCAPYGDITVPDIKTVRGVAMCVARAPDEEFFQDGYYATWGPDPSDSDPDAFVVPIVLSNYMMEILKTGCWQQVIHGWFVTTESGVIVLDVTKLFAWEGYGIPKKRDYNFDRHRLNKSASALKTLKV